MWGALDAERPALATLMRLYLLTAQRGAELRTLAWADVDLDAGWWVIPAGAAKNKLAHRVPLSAPAVGLLRASAVGPCPFAPTAAWSEAHPHAASSRRLVAASSRWPRRAAGRAPHGDGLCGAAVRIGSRRTITTRITLVLLAATSGLPAPARSFPAPAYPGFGYRTTGGAGRAVFVVTALADAGPGSLRDALAQASRDGGTIRFAVGGGIHLESGLEVPGRTTIDGTSAPAPGITLWGARAGARGTGVVNVSASNVVLRGLRIRDAMNDGVQIVPRLGRPVTDVVVDHCSITNSRDGGIDVTGRDGLAVSDVTIVSSYLADNGGPCGAALCGGGSLVNGGATRLSFYYNLWDRNLRRTPSVTGAEAIADIRYNVVRGTVQGAIQIRDGARANLIDNAIEGPRRQRAAVEKWGGRAYVDGTPSDVRAERAIAMLPVPQAPAAKAAALVARDAGAQPRDAADASSIGRSQEGPWDERHDERGKLTERRLIGRSAVGPAPSPPTARMGRGAGEPGQAGR